MEQIIRHDKGLIGWSYLVLYFLLAFTSFEYFFRYTPLTYVFFLVCFILYTILKPSKSVAVRKAQNFVLFYLTSSIIVLLNTHGAGYSSSIGRILEIIGAYFVALIVFKNFIRAYINVMIIISIVALIFYGLYYIEPVRYYIFDNLTPLFPSLNMDNFTEELSDLGGGKNIIIHNYHNGGVSSITGNLLRNCGPFWEPGQFAVFLNIGLFLNIFLDNNNRVKNIIFALALISSFSAGGLAVTMIIILMYALIYTKKWYHKIPVLIVSLFAIAFFVGSDYLGQKIASEMSDKGNDSSRFRAFVIQAKMIADHPILGGAKMSDYTQSKSLANGILLPFVNWGIPFGLVYYYGIFSSCINLAKQKQKRKVVGYCLFVLYIFLAFSQTILTTRWFLVFILIGLLRNKKHFKYGTI